MIVKVVYFDEESATDFMHITEGGKSESKTEKIENNTKEIMTKAGAKAEAKFKWLPFIASAEIDANAEIDLSKSGNTIIKKALSNTILTDYLSKINKQIKKEKVISIFKNYKIYPYPESFAYYKMITPYLIMTEGKFEIENGVSLDIARMDEALESARGYYELIVEDNENNKSILRFNIKAFRNNYGIADLVKMNLTYHAIEVGEFLEENLTMKQEFSKTENIIKGEDLLNKDGKIEDVFSEKPLKVYDVILAGVER